MSKSRGNVQFPQPIVRVLGVDALRYFMLREMVFGQDGNFSREALIDRYNSDLANGLGNFASRTLAMIEKYFGGEVPHPSANSGRAIRDERLATTAIADIQDCQSLYDAYAFSRALERIWELISEVDKYFVLEQPWALAENPAKRERLASVLYTAAEALRIVCLLVHPVMPHATKRIWKQLGLQGNLADEQLPDTVAMENWGKLQPGTRIGKPEPIFPRVDKAEATERIEAMEQEMRQPKAPAAAAPGSSAAPGRITIEDFAKVEMRVGQVRSAERVAGADKLLKLLVDIGDEVRQVVAGIAEVYKPEDLVGRKLIVVVNMQPRKLRGVESNGMVLAAAAGPQGTPVLAGFLEDAPVGARLK